MSKVKICGLTRQSDIDAVNRCKPDYVGFVFAAESRRRLQPEEAAALRAKLSPDIQAVGVFVNQPVGWVASLCEQGVIDLVQLHGEEDADYLATLRRLCTHPVIRAVPVDNTLPPLPAHADYYLFDTATPQRGGAGQPFDRSILDGYTGIPYFLAGGLSPDTVEEAIARLHPYCVDVSSGVETDGVKDPEKIMRFVDLVRRTT
ncbi:MAG: phosphoribosylanthranilate isomerase [Oscillospiraceae bacterium]|nr:phosphoribosylanthranilate isomerase [Oscillospiraceae bacterium]